MMTPPPSTVHAVAEASHDENALDDPTLHLQYRVASSFLEEFAAGHDYPAVMKELVQNEYDAGGHRLEVAFGQDQLVITGHGTPVSADGCQRLGVMMGTGSVPGSSLSIGEKVNGIGSKNFGLRSLFLYGDQIRIYSGGYKTVLDITRGTLPNPLLDPSSRERRGIRIEVPYRTTKTKKLSPFGPDDDEQALSSLAHDLAPMLIKLASPAASNSLRELVITSERCERQVAWKQVVEEIGRRAGTVVLRRRIRVKDSRDPSRRSLEEMEFQRTIPISQDLGSRAERGTNRPF